MITVSELIQKLTLCPSDAVVVYAEHAGASQACTLSSEVYGEATATPEGEDQRPVVILLPDVPSELAQQLEAMTIERDRWASRMRQLESRLDAVRAALEV
jgi:hypothetical protein